MKTSGFVPRVTTSLSLSAIFWVGIFGFLDENATVAAENRETKSVSTLTAARFRFEAVDQKSLGIWDGDRAVLVYNHGAIGNPNAPSARDHSAYLHPIYGLDGEVLTDDFPKDHIYHRGLYWAWSHIKIGGAEYDSWTVRGIRTEFQRWVSRKTSASNAVLSAENGWFVGEKQVMREQLSIAVHPASAESRSIDVELTWTPTDQPVTLQGAEGKSYGGFTFRFGPRSKTIITVPSGRTSDDLVVTKLPWADFSGDFEKPAGRVSGAAVFVHPTHPDYPPAWMTRHYGMLAVGWPGVTAQTLAPGEPVVCRYRIWIHRGPPEAAQIQKAYDLYRRSRATR